MTLNLDPFIRPSSTKENSLCAARPLMQAAFVTKYGHPKQSDVASLGNRAHEWGAIGIRELIQHPDSEEGPILDALREQMDLDGELDKWTKVVVIGYVAFVRALMVKHAIVPGNVLIEHHLTMSEIGYRQGGTADCVLVVPFKKVIVIDAKAGFLEQDEACDNEQLAAYATACAMNFKCDEAEIWLAQPRQSVTKRFSGATFDLKQIRETADWIADVNALCRSEDPPICAGYKQCLYCVSQTRCPAAKEFFMRQQEALELLGDPADPDAWGNLAAAAKLASAFGKAANDQVKAHLGTGGTATGWALSPSGEQTKIDAARAIELAKAAGCLDELLRHASLKASAADIDAIKEAVSKEQKQPSLKPQKG